MPRALGVDESSLHGTILKGYENIQELDLTVYGNQGHRVPPTYIAFDVLSLPGFLGVTLNCGASFPYMADLPEKPLSMCPSSDRIIGYHHLQGSVSEDDDC